MYMNTFLIAKKYLQDHNLRKKTKEQETTVDQIKGKSQFYSIIFIISGWNLAIFRNQLEHSTKLLHTLRYMLPLKFLSTF